MSIQPFIDINVYIEKGTLSCCFISNGKELTELRGMLFIKEMTELMKKINTINTNRIVFLFDIDKIDFNALPSNYKLLKSYAQVFKDHKSVIENKLGFTIVKSEKNIFRMFFRLFKLFYTPIKPLYLCNTLEKSLQCIHDEEELKKLLVLDIKKLK